MQVLAVALSLCTPSSVFANEPAPGTPDLVTESDTGASSTDNITNDDTPTFTVSCISDNVVIIYLDGVQAGTDTCSARDNNSPVTIDWGEGVFVYPDISDGTHDITASQYNPSDTEEDGSPVNYSAALSITVDTSAPSAPDQLDLLASSDLGSSSTDNITSDTTPTIQVACENDATVELYESLTLLGTGTCIGTTIDITTSALALGAHAIKAKQVDIAGNESDLDSATSLIVTIEAEAQQSSSSSSSSSEPAPFLPGGSRGSSGAPPAASKKSLEQRIPQEALQELPASSSSAPAPADESPALEILNPEASVESLFLLTPSEEIQEHVAVRKGERIVARIDNARDAAAAAQLLQRVHERREARRKENHTRAAAETRRRMAEVELLHGAASERRERRMR